MNKRTRTFLLFMAMVITASCSSTGSTTDTVKVSYEELSPFGASYEKISPPQASGYDLLIVEPSHYNRSEVMALKSSGAKIIAYISLGEVNKNRWYFSILQEHGFLGKNENWDSHYINLSDPKTYNLFFDEIIPEIMIRDFDGLFLDTVDAVSPYSPRNHLETDMIRLIQQIRSEYPESLVVQNAGLFLLDSTAKSINAVLIEDVATHFDFNEESYSMKEGNAYKEKVQRIRSLSQSNDLPFLILDFAISDSLQQLAIQRLDKLKYPYFINNIELNSLSSGKTGNNY